MKKNIDIILSVIDNYWDMGFALELLYGLGDAYTYTLWTDNIDAVDGFFARNSHFLGEYRVRDIADFGHYEKISFCIALFHTPIPSREFFISSSLILRVDYLSLDPSWIHYHEKEHIDSTPEQRIIEIIPSPLSDTGGVFPVPAWVHSRASIAEKYWLDPIKKWIPIFVYEKTLLEIIDFSDIPENSEILFLGTSEKVQKSLPKNPAFHFLPFLDIEMFHHILGYADWSIVRGEISAMNMIALEKPFFWDMYKMIGGFPNEQSLQFLENISLGKGYNDVHLCLNWRLSWRISLIECDTLARESSAIFQKSFPKKADIISEVKKYIDSFYFSL